MSDDRTKQITEQEALDRILQYLVDNRSDSPIRAYKIWKDVFPDQMQQLAFHLIKKLLYKTDIVIAYITDEDLNNFDVSIEATDITEMFLKQGGFQEKLAKEKADNVERDRIEELNKRKLQAEVDVIEFQKGLGKKLTVLGLVIAVVSVLASVLATVIQNKGDKNNETIDSLKLKTDSLTKRIKEIEMTLRENKKKINKSDTTINN